MTNRKLEIIDASIELFDRNRGSITSRDIKEYIGCSHTLVFSYFGSMDGLMSACFDEICHRIKQYLQRVSFPENYEDGKVEHYFMEMWEMYLDYLQSHPKESHFYFAMLMRGFRYPKGYTLPTQILKSILGDRYGEIIEKNPDLEFTAIYIISATNGFVQSMINGDFAQFNDLIPRLRMFLTDGILM